jgi:hypothetical protein
VKDRGEKTGGKFLALKETGFVIGPQRPEFYATVSAVRGGRALRMSQGWIRRSSEQDGRNLNDGISAPPAGYFST